MNTDERLRQLVEAEKAVVADPRTSRQGWRRLASAITLGTPSMAIAEVTIPITTASLFTQGAVVAVVVGTVGAVIIAGTAPRHGSSVAVPPASVNTKGRAVRLPAVRSTEPSTAIARTNPSSLPDERLPPPVVNPSRVPGKAPSVTSKAQTLAPADLADELRLISQAKREIDLGSPELAASWLEAHQTQYPAGVLTAERDGLRVLIACGEGTSTDRQNRVAEYASKYPGSPLLDRIRRTCLKD